MTFWLIKHGLVSPGRLATEDIITPFNPAWPRASEQAADSVAAQDVHAVVIRLSPTVHGDEDKHGFIPILINVAREKGFSAYIHIGIQLQIPVVSISAETAEEHFGWFAHMAAIDCPASSKLTQEQLNWYPTHPTLLADIGNGLFRWSVENLNRAEYTIFKTKTNLSPLEFRQSFN